MSSPVPASEVEPEARPAALVQAHDLTTVRVPTSKVKLYPGNARQGDIGAISQSLMAHGQYRPLIVQKSTGLCLAGNHTLQAARQLGWQEIAVTYLDVDNDQAKRIVAVDNRTPELASWDEEALAVMLRDIADSPGGLVGTGYDGDDLDDLLHDIEKKTQASDAADANPGGSNMVVHYDLIFETQDQQETFFDWIRELKRRYKDGDERTAAARIVRYIQTEFQ